MGLNRYRYSGFYNYRSSILSYCVSCALASKLVFGYFFVNNCEVNG